MKIPLLIGVCFVLVRFSDQTAVDTSTDAESNDILIERLSATDAEREKVVVLKKGDSLKLVCEFPSQPWSFIQWAKPNTANGPNFIQANQTYVNGSIKISSIFLSDITVKNGGNYSCISSNAEGISKLKFRVAIKDLDKTNCDEKLCKPNGRCQELLNGYECRCNRGYIGNACQDTDPCYGNRCLNNGSCSVIDDNDFNCTCLQGFEGKTCEQEICLPTSCNSGGSCLQTNAGNIKCECDNYHAGKNCEHRCTFSRNLIKYNYRYYCGRSTVCIINSGTERCVCEDNRIGNRCIMETDIRNECRDPNICNKHGSCNDFTYQYRCNCNSYYSGKNCELHNECSSRTNVCSRNGGRCVDLTVGYKCVNCPEGQTGDKCQYKKNPCQVTCRQSYMEPHCDMRFLDRNMQRMPIYLNSKERECLFQPRNSGNSGRVSKTVSYSKCGTEVKYEDDYIVYRNSLHAGEFHVTDDHDYVITRKAGYFRFDMECKVPIKLNATSNGVADFSLARNLSIQLSDKEKVALPTQIRFFNEFWRSMSNYIVGDRLFVELKLLSNTNNQILMKYGILNAKTCYATPDSAGIGPKYVLIKNGCIKDETLRFERKNNREYLHSVFFSFLSFSFKGDESQKLYLHCDIEFCINKTEVEDTELAECPLVCKEKDSNENKNFTVENLSNVTSAITPQSTTKANLLVRLKRAMFGDQDVIDRNSRKTVELI